MRSDEKVKALISILGPIRLDRSHRGELVFDCPRCKYQRPLLCVNFIEDYFNCWYCRFNSRRRGLANILALSSDKSLYVRYLGTREVTPSGTPAVRREISLPRGFRFPACEVDSDFGRQAATYLAERGVTPDTQMLWKIGVAEGGAYDGRIIFPSFDSCGHLNFMVARSLRPGDVRYVHEEVDRDIVFNEHLVDWREPVTLVEGPFDALAAGPNAVPLLGTWMTPGSSLHRRLVENHCEVYLALDTDAAAQQLRVARVLHRSNVRVMLVDLLGAKDPGELGPARFAEARSRAVEFEGDMTILKSKLERLSECA